MERFVFVAAVTFAVIFAFVAMVGRDHIQFEIGDHERGKAALVSAAPGQMAATAYGGDALTIRHTAAHIVITPEDRTDFSIEIINPGRAPMPLVSEKHGDVNIDGQLRGRVDACRDDGAVNLEGYGELALADLPQITIRAPRTLRVSIGGGSTTEIGPGEAVDLDFLGCGAVSIGDLTGALDVEIAGAGAVNAGAARSLSVDLMGSGDLTTGAIGERATIDATGSGSVTIASLTGELTSDGLGSGDVEIQGGAVTNANVETAGSGSVRIAAPVRSLTVDIIGSGDVAVAGIVGDLNADIAGPGSVSASAVTGRQHQEIMGSGSVNIGE